MHAALMMPTTSDTMPAVAPAATLYLFFNSPRRIMWGGGVAGMLIAVGSVFITNQLDVQTGPAMVILLALFFLLGFALSPRYGLLARLRAGSAIRHHVP